MLIPNDRIINVHKKVGYLRQQLEAMCPGRQGPELSVMDLHYVVEQVYNLTIIMQEVSFSAVYLRGHIERYNANKATIRVRSNLPEADKRLAAVKELCHLVVDEQDDWSIDAVATLELIIEESRARVKAEKHKRFVSPLESEALALLAAIELLYPWEYRETDQQKLTAGTMTLSGIALQHNVPAFVIDEALKNEDANMPLRTEASSQLNGKPPLNAADKHPAL